jgi:hypothetical protein
MAGTGFNSVVENRAPVLQFSTAGITPWQTALKFRLLTVAIRGTINLFVAICDTIFFLRDNPPSKIAECNGPQYTFEHGLPQQIEIQCLSFHSSKLPVSAKPEC